jgi:[methyl-Co(III) methanol-specific corrinoid protein]:coenzyme M methyltransferase
MDSLNPTRPRLADCFTSPRRDWNARGLAWRDVHHEARKMARAAASTFRLTGMPSVTLPLDLCAPAEALGAELVFYDEKDFQFPQVRKALFEQTSEVSKDSRSLSSAGRLPIILDAIRLAKEDIGNDVVISGMIPGPYTLLLYLCDPVKLFIEMKKDPQPVLDALFHLSSFLAQIGRAYRDAGADFITIHEMGGSPGFLGPERYERFVQPAVKMLIENLPAPRVLSVCGSVDKSIGLLAQTGAEAISVDQLTDLPAARAALTEPLLFGNLDPLRTLWRGDSAEVRAAAERSRAAGVDAVWPGCDLVPWTPVENIQAWVG